MNRGGGTRIARRLMAAAVMLGLGVAVVGGGVAFADDSADSGAPVVPGVVTDYRVDTPTTPLVPIQPSAPGGAVALSDGWEWA